MRQEAFLMKLKAGCAAEYRRRHDRIWPELLTRFAECGIRNYSIFYDAETRLLFAVREVDDGFSAESLKDDELFRRWWEYNADLMECNPDRSPKSRNPERFFHLD